MKMLFCVRRSVFKICFKFHQYGVAFDRFILYAFVSVSLN